jgi:peptide/nickel transport system permease protein
VAERALTPMRRRSFLVTHAPILREPLNVLALTLIALFALGALLAPLIAPYDPLAQDLVSRLEPPSGAHWLGTDQLGRDILSRLLYGSRISLVIGVVVVGLAGISGSFVGLIAGYAGGFVDEGLMRLTEVFLAFPPLILAMAIAGALGPSLTNAIIAIAAVTWAVYARLARGQVLSLRASSAHRRSVSSRATSFRMLSPRSSSRRALTWGPRSSPPPDSASSASVRSHRRPSGA